MLAAVYRGKTIESVHAGHIVVADGRGRIIWRTPGLTEAPVFFRSAMKPLQALPLVETGAADAFRLGSDALALACASHSGDPVHVRLAARMLARAPELNEGCLKCGTHVPYSPTAAARLARAGKKPGVLCHNCSGKHIGMLLTCVHEGWPVASYTDPAHPLQQRIKAIVAEYAGLRPGQLAVGRDGCNLPAYAVSLRRMAMVYARLATGSATVSRLTGAMREHPLLVSGKGRSDLGLMEAARGRIFSKIGAEAVWCLGFPGEGLGLALKVADGANRAEVAIMAEALRQTRLLPEAAIARFEAALPRDIRSSDGTLAGEYVAAFRLRRG